MLYGVELHEREFENRHIEATAKKVTDAAAAQLETERAEVARRAGEASQRRFRNAPGVSELEDLVFNAFITGVGVQTRGLFGRERYITAYSRFERNWYDSRGLGNDMEGTTTLEFLVRGGKLVGHLLNEPLLTVEVALARLDHDERYQLYEKLTGNKHPSDHP